MTRGGWARTVEVSRRTAAAEKGNIMTTSHSTAVPAIAAAAPARRTTLLLAVLYSLLFVGTFITGGGEIASDSSGTEVIEEFTTSSTAVLISGYGLVVAAVLIVFWGVAMRARLTPAHRSWTADAVLGGAIALALTLVGWTVTLFALRDAVDSGVPEVAQTVNVINNANFVPMMLGLACTMISVGLTTMREHSLPRWLAIGSIVLGAIAPLGPGGFLPFALFPVWVIVVSALVRTTQDA
jgi:hypothetical protein